MSRVIFEKSYNTASELLAEDESIRDENVFFNENNPNEPRYMLIGFTYSDADSLRTIIKDFTDKGFIGAMPYGELAYYFKTLKGVFSDEEVDEVVRFYIANDSWPE